MYKNTELQKDILSESLKNVHCFSHRSYPRFLYEYIRRSSLIQAALRVLGYIRRLKFVKVAVRIFIAVFAAFETSAIFILTSAIYFAALPFLILGTGLAWFFMRIRSSRQNEYFKKILSGKHIRIFIPSSGDMLRHDGFFCRSVLFDAKKDAGTVALAVSPYIWSKKGFSSKKIFFTAREESEGVFLIRRHYYFVLRREVIEPYGIDYSVIF